MTDYYKILHSDGRSPFQEYHWPLPYGDKPGEWLPHVKNLEECKSGYHVVTAEHILDWLDTDTIFPVEVKGEIIKGYTKCVVQQARLLPAFKTWNKKTRRLFACDCAERVLPLFEKVFPDDDRPRKCIEATRRFARGEITREELGVFWDAAWDAARAAGDAAGDAAWDAAWAAGAAARAARAAGATEKQWQTERLFQYLRGEVS